MIRSRAHPERLHCSIARLSISRLGRASTMCSATPAASSRALTTPCRGHIRLRATSTRSRTGPAVFAVGLSLVEIGGRHARDFQVDLDPIEQWAGHLGAVSLGGARVDREGFIAETNGKSAGKRAWCAAREIITEPVSSGSRTASSRCRSNCGSSGRKKCRGGRARAPRSRVRTFTNQLDGLDGCGGGGAPSRARLWILAMGMSVCLACWSADRWGFSQSAAPARRWSVSSDWHRACVTGPNALFDEPALRTVRRVPGQLAMSPSSFSGGLA